MTRAVLVVPSPGDPHGLLREGLCGTNPPVSDKCSRCPEDVWEAMGDCCDCTIPDADALVLVWDGVVALEGFDRLARRLSECDEKIVGWDFWPRWEVSHAVAFAEQAVLTLGGRVEVLP